MIKNTINGVLLAGTREVIYTKGGCIRRDCHARAKGARGKSGIFPPFLRFYTGSYWTCRQLNNQTLCANKLGLISNQLKKILHHNHVQLHHVLFTLLPCTGLTVSGSLASHTATIGSHSTHLDHKSTNPRHIVTSLKGERVRDKELILKNTYIFLFCFLNPILSPPPPPGGAEAPSAPHFSCPWS